MHRRDRRLLVAGVVVVVAVAVLAVVVIKLRSDRSPSGVASDLSKTIPSDGATLSAEVITPKGSGRAPLLVMPGSWGSPATEYHRLGATFAAFGYEVVAYAQRGFGGSSGKVDFLGPASQRDVSTVITWALHHTRADPRRVGLFGISYGAGAALLAAARDPRVRAVAVTSTLTSFARSFDDAHTPSTGALHLLIKNVAHRASFDGTMQRLQRTLATDPGALGPLIRSMSPIRSPDSYVRQLNRNKPAIFIANALEDALLNPGQLVPFYESLRTPKRLELAVGDHGGPELSGLAGSPNSVVGDARAWLDHFLRGKRNGVQTEAPIEFEDVRTRAVHTYKTWPHAAARDRLPLPKPGIALEAGARVSPNWSASVDRAGTDSGATSGPMQYFASSGYRPPELRLAAIDKRAAFVWDGPALGADLVVGGTPVLRVGLASSAPDATVFAYLYDVTAQGVGHLMDVQPYTAVGLRPGHSRYVTISMQPTAWTVPRGDHLSIVVDTADPRYRSLTPPGATVTLSSTASRPASFTAPVRS